MTPGRQKLSATRILARMTPEEEAIFRPAVDDLVEKADEAAWLRSRRKRGGRTLYGERAREKDTGSGAALSLIHSTLEGYVRLFPQEDEQGGAARRLLELFVPHGLGAVVRQRYDEQLIDLQRILRDAAEPDNAAMIERIPGLGAQIAELSARTERYAAALDPERRAIVSYQDVRAAISAGDRRLTELLAMIFAHYRGDEDAAMRRRTELVEPYFELLADLRERYRRRLPPADVNAETGELDDQAEDDIDEALAAEAVDLLGGDGDEDGMP